MNFSEQVILLIIGALVGGIFTFLGQLAWHKYARKEERRNRTPEVVVGRYAYGDTIYVELVNIGDDDINELEVYIKSMQGGKLEEKKLKRFFELVDNPITDSAKTIEYLSSGGKVRVASIPQLSDDGIIKVIIRGAGATSGKRLDQVVELKVSTPVRIRTL